MADKRFWGLAAGTTACALAIGFVMQTFLDDPDRAARPIRDLATHQPVVVQFVAAPAAPQLPILTEAAEWPDFVARNHVDALFMPAEIPVPVQETVPPTDACKMSVQAGQVDRASVALRIEAPCSPNARITVHHAGLSFTLISDSAGLAGATVPALSEQAVFIVSAGEGASAVATLKVPELGGWHRAALQWTGQAGFEIHARELGAAYGDPGHVWNGAMDNPETGSFLTRLGTAHGPQARMIEIYSVPKAAARGGNIALSVEAEVTAESCGAEVVAQVVQRQAGAATRSRDLTLAMPGCSAVGDFLVLNNLLEDLKIASN